MLENPSARELAQWIDRRRLLQRIGATVGVAGFVAILAPSLSVSAYASGGSGALAQQPASGDQAPAASLAGPGPADGGPLTVSPGPAGAAGDASSLPSSSPDTSGSADAAGAGAAGDASSLPSSSPDTSGSGEGAGAASGAAQAQPADWATPTELKLPRTNYDD